MCVVEKSSAGWRCGRLGEVHDLHGVGVDGDGARHGGGRAVL
jgi:hypothetical protein